MESQSSILLRRLNHYCAKALEGAASLCQTRAHAEITPEHWLLKLLEQGQGDLTVLARRYEWDMDAVWQSLLSWLDAQPRSVRSRPELSAALQSLLKQAWLAATLAGDEQIRSVHLLTAMVETSGLTHCEGIWPLMTLTASQLEKLRPLLEVQSDERHDIASSSTVSNVTVIGRAAPLQGEMPKTENPGAVQDDTVLNRFTVNVTARASEGKIDPVFGRDNEIRQMVDILSRRRKNNPILVGEPGVGKTALVEGLALRIAEGNVPESLSECAKDIRVVTWYIQARLSRDGEKGLSEGLLLLVAMLTRFGQACHPQRPIARKAALEWLNSAKVIDTLLLWPEVDSNNAGMTTGVIIRLRFECPEKVDWSKVGIDKVAIYLNAESPVSSALHLAMTRRVHAMYARHAGTHTERHQFDGWCKPMGFDDNDGLWKKADTAFSGYQLLLEYFSFRPKFMFVELRGLDTIGLTAASTWFEIDIVLSEAWSSDLPFETENFRLHCAPVINLFTLEADPLTLNPLDNEYLLRPLRLQDGHTEIYSVDNIHGAIKNGKHPYVPFTSFRHRGGMMRHDAPERYFHTRVKRGPSGLYDTWLILGGRSFELEQLSEKPESLSMRITGTNGQLPRKALESTLLDRVVKAGKVPVMVRNLSAPTMPLYPPANDRFHWRVMSHLGSNFLSMMDNPEVLRGTLALYDWTDDEMNRRRLEAIVAVKHTLIRRFEKGFMLRGVDIEVTLNMDNFAGEGDVNLFGEMLHRFFALYADIHLFNQLTLVLQPTGKRLRWRENHSQHVPG